MCGSSSGFSSCLSWGQRGCASVCDSKSETCEEKPGGDTEDVPVCTSRERKPRSQSRAGHSVKNVLHLTVLAPHQNLHLNLRFSKAIWVDVTVWEGLGRRTVSGVLGWE